MSFVRTLSVAAVAVALAGSALAAPGAGAAPLTGSLADLATGASGAGSTGASGAGSLGSDGVGTPFHRAARPATGAEVVGEQYFENDPRVRQLYIKSPAFGRVIRLGLLLPADQSAPRPTLQMLDGFKGWQTDESLQGGSDWLVNGGAREFFRDKNVNVVLAVDGGPSFYRDWAQPLPDRGTQAWETFLSTEVPDLIDNHYGGNGVWGIAGLSMGAQATFMQAVRHPELYSTVAGFSGCYDTSDDFGRAQITQTLKTRGIDAAMIFGPESDPRWQANDPWLHTEALRGKTLWFSAASGKPGVSDWDSVMASPKTSAEGSFQGIGQSVPGIGQALSDVPMLDPILAGGPYEAIAMNCTRRFEEALAAKGIPSATHYVPTGVHDWNNWRAELPNAWPTLAKGLGVTG